MSFQQSYDFVLYKLELGSHNPSPNDLNPTKDGVTQNTYKFYYPGSVFDMTNDQRDHIYQAFYDKSRAVNLVYPLDAIHFAAFFNMAPGDAIKCLQRFLGVTPDGVIGPATISAMQRADIAQLNDLISEHMSHYYDLQIHNAALRPNLSSWIGRLVEGRKL